MGAGEMNDLELMCTRFDLLQFTADFHCKVIGRENTIWPSGFKACIWFTPNFQQET
jgi:hypothetical protein